MYSEKKNKSTPQKGDFDQIQNPLTKRPKGFTRLIISIVLLSLQHNICDHPLR